MFTLEDGREQLYQWDLDRRIIVNDPKICEVHFCNRTSDCSLVVKVYTDDTYKTYAAIPNILLQEARPIRAYAYCDDKYTLTEQQFTVKARTRPDDYVYTETEILQYSTLDERIRALEANITDTVATEVNKYMENNPVNVDLTDYYTKAQTDSAIGEAVSGIKIPEVDLTPYAKVADMPTKVSQLENDSNYATEQYVDDAIANIDIPEGGDVDLTNYVTTDTEQSITGAKTFTSPIKVTNSTNTVILSDRGVSFTDNSSPGVSVSNPINEYGLRIYLDGTGYLTDGESQCLFFYDDNPTDYPTLGKKDAPWYRAYIKNLSDGTTTKSMTAVLSAPTMDEVNQAIQDAISTDTGNSDGSSNGVEQYCLPWSLNQLTDENKTFIAEYIAYYNTNGKIKPVEIYFFKGTNYYPATSIIIGTESISFYTCQTPDRFDAVQYSFTNGTYSSGWHYQMGGETSDDSWKYASTLDDSNLYSAKEVYIMVYATDKDYGLTSHVILPDTYSLYEYVGKCFAFTTPDGMDYNTPYWRYDGSAISIGRIDSYELITIAYKE